MPGWCGSTGKVYTVNMKTLVADAINYFFEISLVRINNNEL
jgi:hypothetical protein